MKKIFIIAAIFFLVTDTESYAQQPSATLKNASKVHKKGLHTKWSKNPFDDQVFIENKGQFDGILPGNEKVYYAVRMGDIQAFFTEKGIVYRLKHYPKLNVSKGQDPDEDGPIKPIIKYLYSQWMDANANVQPSGDGKQLFYYTYPSGMSGTIKTDVYKKITYHNLYPGIDVEYSFKNGKEGIEYKVIVHPGADISLAKLLYGNGAVKSNVTTAGAIETKTNMGVFNMSVPEAFYDNDNSPLNVSYVLNGNEESFLVKNADKSKTYTIDPWITDPLFSSIDKAYDLDYDNYGNIYVYGGDANPYQLIKLNSAGAIQWVFNATLLTSSTNFYGDLAVDRVTAESYLVEGWNSSGGARAEKINTNGVLMATFPGNSNLGEMYRVEYDACNRDLIVGGGGTTYPYQSCILDTAMVSITPVNVENVATGYHDMALLTIDPDGSYCYMATTQSLVYIGVENNYLLKLPLPSLSPPVYNVFDGLSFHEIGSVNYVAGTDNGFNGMAASPNWLYLYAGDTLMQVNKATGLLNKKLPLTTLSDYLWGGLDVDACDDIYVGFRDSIKIYNSSLLPEDSLALTPGDTIFDLHLGQNNLIYACGLNFVSSIDVPNPPTLISSATGTPSSCQSCNGTATVNINCGIAPYLFKWSDGSTNKTDTGLCAGIYTVTVTDAACPPHTDTAIVNVSGENGFTAFVTHNNPDCARKKGNATVYVTGGNPPYTYLWSNGSTTSMDTGLVAGTYICVITDSAGCKFVIGVTLVNPKPPVVNVVPALDSLCLGSSVVLTASGATIYSWTPPLGLSCSSCSNPTATPSVTTTYQVIGSDTNGCKDSVNATIKVYTIPKPIITGRDTVCSGFEDTLSATGGLTYKWSNGATTTSIRYYVANTQTITVTAYNGMCSHDTTFVIHTINPLAKVTESKDSICAGDSVLLTGSGGISYKWNTGSTTTTIWVKPPTTKTYTLYAYGPTCHDSATIKVKIIPLVTESVSITQDSICPHGSTKIIATGSGGQVTYRWSNGATTSSITVSDTVTTVYTVTAYGICDSVQKTMTVTVVPLPKPVITGTLSKCKGQRDTLTVTNSVNPATYLWSDGKTTTTIYTGNINADSTFYVTAFNKLNCLVTDTFHVKVIPYPTGNITYPPGCGSNITTITASANGSGTITYKWNTGGTNDTIDVYVNKDTTSYSVIISNDGCPITKTVNVIKYFPPFSACCNSIILLASDTTINASGANIVRYKWLPDTALNCDTCATVVASPTVTTTYTVIATDTAGCESERVVTIVVEIPCFELVIPNVFTPSNGGLMGLDKVFYIKTKNMDAWSLQIYDRWGKEMFSSTNPNEYWDGTTKGGGAAPAGVYYYIISGTCQNTTYKKDGFVQLIR